MLKEMYNLINRLGPTNKALILMWLDNYDYETMMICFAELDAGFSV